MILYYKMYSRGDSGALYLQSALAGVMSCRGCLPVKTTVVSGVDAGVLAQQKPVNRVRTGMEQH